MQDLFAKAQSNLNEYWGYPEFRPGQEEVIRSVLDGKETLVLFPTGGGKSLCYQIPATVFEGLTLVISPLVALMQDQVQQLKAMGISATFINSTIPKYEVEQRLVNARNGMYKLLYCAPERLNTHVFKAELERLNIELVAVDEAHCISEWGHDFRPAYREIRPALEPISEQVKWIALTATATPAVQKDILENLEFKEPEVIRRGFSRPNLKWWVVHTDNKRQKMLSSVERIGPKGDGLIYGGTRKNCEDLAGLISEKGIPTEAYHAGVDSFNRKAIQERWISGETPLVVATNAFGMGIDKPDCRYVFHEEMPYSLEAYYQEAGRAGRDGEESFPILFYRDSDYIQARKRIQENYPTFDELHKVYVALCDYLGLAVGSEMLEMVGYDLDKVQTRCALPKSICASSIRLMEQFGVLALDEDIPPSVSLQFTLSPEMLIKFKERCQNPDKAEFVDKLERMFGHFAFADMVDKDLDFVLEKLSLGRNTLVKGLNVLMQNDQILIFTLYPERNLVRLLEARSREVPVKKAEVESFRNSLLEKLDKMNGYANTRECREVYLKTYFGDEDPEPCGHCDNCLDETDTPEEEITTEDIRTVFDLLIEKKMHHNKAKKKAGLSKEKMIMVIQYLIGEHMIESDPEEQGYYRLSDDNESRI